MDEIRKVFGIRWLSAAQTYKNERISKRSSSSSECRVNDDDIYDFFVIFAKSF